MVSLFSKVNVLRSCFFLDYALLLIAVDRHVADDCDIRIKKR